MSNPYLKLDPASRRHFMLKTAKTALGVSVLSHFEALEAASEPAAKKGRPRPSSPSTWAAA